MIVNGVSLDNSEMGWVFRAGSVPYSSFEANLSQINLEGRDGVVPMPSAFGAPLWSLTVNTPPSGWEALQALFLTPTLVLTDVNAPGRQAIGRLASSSVDRVFDRNEWIDVTFFVQIPGGYWRDKVASVASAPLTSASVSLTIAPGGSAPISDAVVRVRGSATGLRVQDAGGSWVALPDVDAGQWVRFESASGRCFATTTETWVGGVEISGQVDFGGPRNRFEITPVMQSDSPAVRSSRLTITSATRSSALIEVSSRAAYAR